MISYEKECEDDNNVDYDGCFECRFKCALEC